MTAALQNLNREFYALVLVGMMPNSAFLATAGFASSSRCRGFSSILNTTGVEDENRKARQRETGHRSFQRGRRNGKQPLARDIGAGHRRP